MGKQWKNAPVYFVIAQVRYSPVLSLASYIARIQEDFRKVKFPDFKKGLNITFNVNLLAGLKPGDEQPMQQYDRYLFANETGTESFILEHNGLTFQTTEYKTFDVLMEAFLSRLEHLNETLDLSFFERVGLRYLDAVMPSSDESLESYLIPQVLGIQGKIAGEVEHSFSETLISTPEGKIMSRVVMQKGKIGFPLDLNAHATGMKLNSRFSDFTGQFAILDTDGFNESREKFDRIAIEKKFRQLHRHVDATFSAITTKHAVKTWS